MFLLEQLSCHEEIFVFLDKPLHFEPEFGEAHAKKRRFLSLPAKFCPLTGMSIEMTGLQDTQAFQAWLSGFQQEQNFICMPAKPIKSPCDKAWNSEPIGQPLIKVKGFPST